MNNYLVVTASDPDVYKNPENIDRRIIRRGRRVAEQFGWKSAKPLFGAYRRSGLLVKGWRNILPEACLVTFVVLC